MPNKTKLLAILPDRRKSFALIGVLLILISFFLIYHSLNKAQVRDLAIVAVRDLAFGEVVSAEDIKAISVDLGSSQNQYSNNQETIIGKTVVRNIYQNELISHNMLGGSKNLRMVAMKLPLGSVPPNLQVNDTIDLWWINPETLKVENLLNSINTSDVIKEGSGYTSTITVVVAVAPQLVGSLITALKAETIEVVKHEN